MPLSGRGRWRAALGASALLAAVPVALAIPSVVAAPRAADGACSGNDGVTVVVDFGTLVGGAQTRCAAEPVSSGYDALEQAGFTVTGTNDFPGLLCRIDGKPADDPCQRAPKSNYYWAYWTASAPGEPWTYSQEGAGTRDPAAGSVDGWAFSNGCTRKPGASTTCPSAATTTTTVTSPTTTTAAAAPGITTTTRRSVTTTSVDGASDHPASAGADQAIAEPSAADDASVSDSQSALDDVDRVGTTTTRRGSGSPAGVAIGAIAVVLLGVGAALRVRTRRASSSEQGAE